MRFEEYIREKPNATDLDLINWLAIKIKSRFPTRAKGTLIPLDLYPGSLDGLDEDSTDDIPEDKLPTTTFEVVPKPKPKKTPICPQYFDYKAAMLCIQEEHKKFKACKLDARNLKSKKIALSELDIISGDLKKLGTQVLKPKQLDKQTPSTSAISETREDSSMLASPAQSLLKSSSTGVPFKDGGGTKSINQSNGQFPTLLASDTLVSARSAQNNSGGPLPEPKTKQAKTNRS